MADVTPTATTTPQPAVYTPAPLLEEVRSGGHFLERGHRGEAVAHVQRLLGIPADGKFGNVTAGAVAVFQHRKGLHVDAALTGKVGPLTLAALEASPALPPLTVSPATEAFSVDSDLKTRPSPLTAAKIDAYMEKMAPGLKGIGEAVMAAAAKHGINATYIVAHAIHETGWGKSKIFREKNNLFGWSAFDATPFASAKGFPDHATCIDFVMGKVNALYLKPGGKHFRQRACLGDDTRGMNVMYASDKQWGEKIARIARKIEKETGV